MRRLVLLCGTWGLLAQEAYFKEEAPPWWQPAWELTLRRDRIGEPEEDYTLVTRESARLRLRWARDAGEWSWALGSWSALGSDGNRFNIGRYDQQPSNGHRLDAAWIQWARTRERGFMEVRLGHQENPLLSQESLWDKDLRVTGLGLRAAWRGEGIPELGLRAVGGRVRTLLDGNVTLTAAQGVLRFEFGPVDATLHAGRWILRFDPSTDRERFVPGLDPAARQELRQDVAGAGLVWHAALPLEVKAIRHRDPVSGEDGAEFQAWIGSRSRTWWPQVGYVWQRFDRMGTLYPVNGDDWWFMWNARGPRWEVALPLPHHWLLVATYLQHRWYRNGHLVDRSLIQLVKRF